MQTTAIGRVGSAPAAKTRKGREVIHLPAPLLSAAWFRHYSVKCLPMRVAATILVAMFWNAARKYSS